MSKGFLIDTIDCFISGDWGTDSYSIDSPIKVNCIRGADINNINSNDVDAIPTRYISERSLSNKMLSAGDLVVEKSGGSPTQSTGRVAYISEHVVTSSGTVCSNFCTAFRVKDKWDSKYIYYYLRYIYDLGVFFNFEGKTSGIKNLDLERAYESIPIRYIPKEKQRKIVKVLSLLDNKIELNNKIISELEHMAKELYDYWFVQFDFPDANGKPYRSSGGKMTYNPTLKREMPESWFCDNICRISSIGSGGTPSKSNVQYWNGNIPFFGPTDYNGYSIQLNTQEYITDFGLLNCSSSLYEQGTVIITARGSIGKKIIVGKPMAMNQSCYALVPKWNCSEYLFLLTENLIDFLRMKGSGSVFKSIVSSDIENTSLCIAPREIIDKFCSHTKSLWLMTAKNIKENKELATLRDWLLPMLMNGQVTVQAETKAETKTSTPIINLSRQRNQRFELWLSNQGAAARGEIDKATLREIFDAMDEDDK